MALEFAIVMISGYLVRFSRLLIFGLMALLLNHFELLAMPPNAARIAYLEAVDALVKHGDKARSSKLFDKVATTYPDSQFAERSRELAGLLAEMRTEERRKHKADVGRNTLNRIFNVQCIQIDSHEVCHVLHSTSVGDPIAHELKTAGDQSIPLLVGLLSNRKPIRTTAWKILDTHVLRYQDVGYQILEELLPDSAFDRNLVQRYFSNTSVKNRTAVIRQIVNWSEDNSKLRQE